ncbi:hypothetical protein CWS02_00595 [Enterobacter sp. EA-1]|nr:hypothetical protein CWS02_00595 [Enterobacter sp. EA-1]
MFIDSIFKQQRNIEYQFIKEQLLLQTAENNVAITRDIIIDKVVLNLGAMPRQHLSLYFYQRLHGAGATVYTVSQPRAIRHYRWAAVTETASGQHGSLVAQAIACLQSAGAKNRRLAKPQTDALRAPVCSVQRLRKRFIRRSLRGVNDYLAASVGSSP